jgi:hypothetical protein
MLTIVLENELSCSLLSYFGISSILKDSDGGRGIGMLEIAFSYIISSIFLGD